MEFYPFAQAVAARPRFVPLPTASVGSLLASASKAGRPDTRPSERAGSALDAIAGAMRALFAVVCLGAGCTGNPDSAGAGETADVAGETGDSAAPHAYEVFWGDLHAHSGLSPDGCENPAALCLPDATLPGENFFGNAAANGLSFAAITDHAEFVRYERPVDGVVLDIWDRTHELIAAAEGGPVIPILGYEWTASGSRSDQAGVHRTVLIEDPSACEAFRVPGYPQPTPKDNGSGGELYRPNLTHPIVSSPALAAALAAAGTGEGCAPSRTTSFLHHVAASIPAAVEWTNPAFPLESDTVVEMASEHGTSECQDPELPDCDWHLHAETYDPLGSVQTALAAGFQLGFVGGTDRHDADPGQLGLGPGASGHLYDSDGDDVVDAAALQYTTGTLTGVFANSPLTRSAIFDALASRHTLVASRVTTGLSIAATNSTGTTFLPGDALVPGAYSISVSLVDPLVTSWSAELVAPSGLTNEIGELTFATGDIWYVRMTLTVEDVEHRVWASPFFTL